MQSPKFLPNNKMLNNENQIQQNTVNLNQIPPEGNKKHLTIALVGAPNAGKSTLANALIGEKVLIVSPKPQTTRNSIKAIAIHHNTQLILIDTPGLFIPKQDRLLERIIVKSAWQGLRDAEYILFIFDASSPVSEKTINLLTDLKKEEKPITIVLNKIDLLKKTKLLLVIEKFASCGFEDIRMISAKENLGIEELKSSLTEKATERGWPFDPEDLTNASMQFLATEITREQLFIALEQELPYSLTVKNEMYQILDNKEIKIKQVILVEKESQKKIILGRAGRSIKEIGTKAREEIAKLAGTKVHLYLFVKVENDWMHNSENYQMIDLDKIPKKSKNNS